MQAVTLARRYLKPFSFLVFIFIFVFSGCSYVKLVADYDSTVLEQILDTGKKVDRFYGMLLETPEKDRNYSKYVNQYVDIEVDLRAQLARNQARTLNRESTRISELILEEWVKCKETQKSTKAYPNGTAKLDRNRFTRMFGDAAEAEMAKKPRTSKSD